MKRLKESSGSIFPPVTPHVFKILRNRRRALKLSQQFVADKSGLSRTTICEMEQGKRPRMSMAEVEGIANCLGMTLHTLLALADQDRLRRV